MSTQPGSVENLTNVGDHGSGRHHHGAPRFRFSQEEMRVLRECNRESFYFRCIPIGTTAMLLAHYAVKAGYLRGSPKYGSLWKVLGAGFIGYFVGKYSYRSKCEEKIMQLPNSQLAEALRRRKQGLSPFPEIYTMDPTYGGQSGDSFGMSQNSNYSDSDTGGTWDIDEDKNVKFHGLDESKRPTVDNSVTPSTEDQSSQSVTSYEALRKHNRDEYEARRMSAFQKKEQTSSGQRFPTRSDEGTSVTRTNIYGDPVE